MRFCFTIWIGGMAGGVAACGGGRAGATEAHHSRGPRGSAERQTGEKRDCDAENGRREPRRRDRGCAARGTAAAPAAAPSRRDAPTGIDEAVERIAGAAIAAARVDPLGNQGGKQLQSARGIVEGRAGIDAADSGDGAAFRRRTTSSTRWRTSRAARGICDTCWISTTGNYPLALAAYNAGEGGGREIRRGSAVPGNAELSGPGEEAAGQGSGSRKPQAAGAPSRSRPRDPAEPAHIQEIVENGRHGAVRFAMRAAV